MSPVISALCPPRGRALVTLLAVLLVLLAVGGAYWLGQRAATPIRGGDATPATAGGARQLLYYRNPMGLPDTSPTPKKDPMGMDYIAVYADDDGAQASAASSAANSNALRISSEKVQQLGVRSEAAQLRQIARTVRAAGRVEPDERRSYVIAPKFEGYVERLHVNVTGQAVARGQALFDVYSPELVAAQRDYAIAAHGVETLKGAGEPAQAGIAQLAAASLARLRNWDVSDAQLKTLVQTGEAQRTLTFRSPVAGIVSEKKALQGMRFMPGEALYQIVDLSSVWVIADVFEQDLALVQLGAPARVRINAYPDKLFTGKVSYVYPTLDAATRTVALRIELANPGLLLKPAMYALVELSPAKGAASVVSVPLSAVIDSGTRQVVLIDLGAGRFAPRQVRLGLRDEQHVEVIEGVRAGERVVVAANFLIDAESNLKAALDGFGPAPASTGSAPAASGAARAGSHHAEGRVEAVDAQAATVSLAHGPVASLKWPAMSMDFVLANSALLAALKPGSRVAVDFVERAPGEWVIISVKALGDVPAAPGDAAHAAH